MAADEITHVLASWGYPGLFVLLVLTGIGSPLPEDFLLLMAGYLTSAGIFSWPTVFVISWVGVVLSDLILYAAGRHLAWHSTSWPEGHVLSPARLAKATFWFDRWGARLVFVARLVPGTRAVVFLTAGLRAVPLSGFLAYDSLGALVWVLAMLGVGRAAGSRLGDVSEIVQRLNGETLWVLLCVLTLFVMWLSLGREQSKL